MASIRTFGMNNAVAVRGSTIVAGHARVAALKAIWAEGDAVRGCPRPHMVPTIDVSHLSDDQMRAYVIADNQLTLNATYDLEILKLELAALDEAKFDLGVLGFHAEELGELMFDSGSDGGPGGGGRTAGLGSLAERFGVPPFSVLSARDGWWQDRKRAWIALGIQSELGRGELANDRGESDPARMNDAADMQRRSPRANAEPGGSKRPAADYGKSGARGDGAGRALRRRPNAIPGGGPMPLDRQKHAQG